MDKTLYLALVTRRNRYHSPTLTNRYRGIAINHTTRFCSIEYRLQSLRHLPLVLAYLLSNGTQRLRGIVPHISILVNDTTDICYDMPQRLYESCQSHQRRIDRLIATMQELRKVACRDKGSAESDNLANFEECTLNLCLLDDVGDIVKLLLRSLSLGKKDKTHLFCQGVTTLQLALDIGKHLTCEHITSVLHRTQCNHLLADSRKAYLRLKVLGIDYRLHELEIESYKSLTTNYFFAFLASFAACFATLSAIFSSYVFLPNTVTFM